MDHTPVTGRAVSRRRLLTGAAGVAAAGAFAGAVAAPLPASAARDGFGLRIVHPNTNTGRLQYWRFETNEIEWDPAVNILLPEGYHTSGKRYPVLYMLHGGGADFRQFDQIGNLVGNREIIVVMPDASTGWYSNPVSSFAGPRNWETFHMMQLLPWVDANFRTFPEYDGRAVAGFSMGGFGALKYTHKYFGHFCSVSAHSGPASLRRDNGMVVHWANVTSAALDLGGGTVYGAPFWNEARVSADNPMENIERYRDKRIFMVAGTSPELVNGGIKWVSEREVLAGQREFRAALTQAGIPHDAREAPGGHEFRADHFIDDLDGMMARLRRAG
ncbi:alpha/beta hydrolase [Micromonospora sp. KLBMP9576]|uniref:alpha/beta hydrolase n=1 Tax=Micromonospora sp. KLBMP9576 TaxID=3424769 RepID=UPI003D8FD795